MNSAIAAASALLLLAGPARADTLRDAIALAWRTSPVLHGQQALQRAVGEGTVQARAAWLPQVGLSASAGYVRTPYDQLDTAVGTEQGNAGQAALTLNQALYSGGRVASAVRAATARARAGEQGVRGTAAQLFQGVIGAYMDVLRDAAILQVRRADLATLQRQVADTGARFTLGDAVTRTDVAQAQGQRDAAAASLQAATAQLEASRAEYLDIVGIQPRELSPPAPLPGMPATLAAAVAAARGANPALQQARATAEGSDADIGSARAAAMPTVALQAAAGEIGPVAPLHAGQYQQALSAEITITQPIFTGGLIASQIRAAQDRHEADRQASATAERAAVQTVLTAWSAAQAGHAAIAANRSQVANAQTALRGYQAEYGYGLRSTLDVLIADENLRTGQVALAVAQHDTIVAEAAVLAAVGTLDARTLLAPADAARGTLP